MVWGNEKVWLNFVPNPVVSFLVQLCEWKIKLFLSRWCEITQKFTQCSWPFLVSSIVFFLVRISFDLEIWTFRARLLIYNIYHLDDKITYRRDLTSKIPTNSIGENFLPTPTHEKLFLGKPTIDLCTRYFVNCTAFSLWAYSKSRLFASRHSSLGMANGTTNTRPASRPRSGRIPFATGAWTPRRTSCVWVFREPPTILSIGWFFAV